MLTDGGEATADIDVLRHQSGVLGPVASPPTVWRTLDEVSVMLHHFPSKEALLDAVIDPLEARAQENLNLVE